MHASPERPLPSSQPPVLAQRHHPAQLHPWHYGNTLIRVMWSFLRLLRRALWRAVQHDAFTMAKAAAYSAILTLFPALLVVGATLATSHHTAPMLREISYAVGKILPTGSATAVAYLKGATSRPVGLLITTSLITLWTASGVMVSWMEGFRNAYQLPKSWGLVKERMIAFGLVIMAGIPMLFATILVAFGTQIETRLLFYAGHDYGPYVLALWTLIRWTIAILTSIAVIALIYHHAVPRTQPWHTVLPGSCLGTAAWFAATMAFGWYLRHYAEYSILYGSLGLAIALMVWMFMVSVIVLVGAEMNAMLFPRCLSLKDRPAQHREPEVYVR
jgi:membrane protein